MDFFATSVVVNPNATAETLVKQRISWNAGLKGCFGDDTRKKISENLKSHTHRQSVYQDPAYKELQSQRVKNSQKAIDARIASRSKAEETKRANGYYDQRKKPIQTPNGVFNSIEDIMIASNRSKRTVMYWLKKYPEHYYYITK